MPHKIKCIEELDEEFKTCLKEIQPYFSALKWTNYDIEICQSWLHKLFNADRSQISLRNAYLTKLTKNLKDGELKEPFNKLPVDNEPLLPLTTYLPMHFNIRCNETENTKVHNLVSDMINYPMTVVVHKHVRNNENSNEYIKELIVEDNCNNEKISNTNGSLNSSKGIQCHKNTSDNNEGGDGLVWNNETKIKLESIEKMFDELKTKNEFLSDQVQLYVDRNKLNNDHITMTNAELIRIKNDIDKMRDRETIKESEYMSNFNNIVEKTNEIGNRINNVISEVKNLKLTIEDTCLNKKNVDDLMEFVDYMKEMHYLQQTENQRHFIEQTSKFEEEIDQLKVYADIKAKEVDTLEELVINQNTYIDSYEKSMKLVEEYVINENTQSTLSPDIKNSQTSNLKLHERKKYFK